MKKIFKQVWEFIKNLFKKFVLDSKLLEIGIDRIIKVILNSDVNAKVEFYKYAEQLSSTLKNEFGNIKPINKIIDKVILIIDKKYGSIIDSLKGGLKVKLKYLKELLLKEISAKFK